MRVFLFLSVVVAVLGTGFGYLTWRLGVGREDGHRRVVRWGMVALATAIVAALGAALSGGEGPVTDTMAFVGFGALGFASLLFTFVVLRDLGWGAWATLRRLRRGPAFSPERRRVILSSLDLGKVGASGLMLGWGVGEAVRTPRVVRVDVPLEDLPEDLEGFTIAQITDLHVGPTIKADYVTAVVEAINALQPDIVAVTGDLVDGSVPYLEREVAPLADLAPRYGTFFCTGNHEYYSGVHGWLEEVDRLGMVALVNEHRVMEIGAARLLVAGVTDYRAERHEASHATSPEDALAGAPACDAKLLLAHQPRSIHRAAAVGFDLQISGHTHGGQFFPWNFFVHLGQPYVEGLHRHDRTWIYVSRGTGYWGPPLRIGAPSEITLLRLVTPR